MKNRFLAYLFLLLATSCVLPSDGDPYVDTLCTLTVRALYPSGYSDRIRAGVPVKIEEINLGTGYQKETDASGVAVFNVPEGLYRVSVSDMDGEDIFNGSADKVRAGRTGTVLSLNLLHSKAGTIVIKEIYCGGCKRLPQEGNYQYDQYLILHNNDFRVQYLDGLCIGSLHPYNAMATNPFVSKDAASGESVFPAFVPVSEAVWQFGGDGTLFPLQPGEDAVVCLKGAIDHSAQFPLSVNLDRPGYFVCYNSTYFTNTAYHPTPGVNISSDRYLEVVVKTGVANAYTFSINSPAVVLYRAQGMTMREWVQTEGAVIPIPGGSTSQVAAVPLEWVVDAVEVFSGTSSSNSKRLAPSLDAGYVTLSDTYLGHTLFRHTDEELSVAAGYEVLKDTNNSSVDFYERETQSLHD